MAQAVSAKTDRDHREALEAMVEAGEADSLSEAFRQTSQAELARRGYLNGTHKETRLSKLATEFGKAFLWIGIAWATVTLLWPVGFRTPALFAFLAAAGAFGVKYAANEWKPPVLWGEKA